MMDVNATVVENRALSGGHYLLTLHSPRQARLVRPGQFAMVRLLGRCDVLLRRPMSIYDARTPGRARSAPHGKALAAGTLQLLYKCVGKGTRLMGRLKAGDQVGLLAPLGHGFFIEEYLEQAKAAQEVLHVAGGIGIAALLLPARELARAGVPQRLFFGGRTRADLVGYLAFKPYVRQTVLATEDGSRGEAGYVTVALEAFLKKRTGSRFLMLVCGPWAMMRAAVELANKYGHAARVSMENRMGCGLGVCLGCSIRVQGEGHGSYQRVCTEGPVFDAEKVIWT